MSNEKRINATIDEVIEVVVKIIQPELLKQMHPMVHNNDYPSMAVPHAVILDMLPLVKEPLRTALEGLAGDSKNFIGNYITYGKAIDEILEAFHLKQIDLIEVKKRVLDLVIPHPSEREVLEEQDVFDLTDKIQDEAHETIKKLLEGHSHLNYQDAVQTWMYYKFATIQMQINRYLQSKTEKT